MITAAAPREWPWLRPRLFVEDGPTSSSRGAVKTIWSGASANNQRSGWPRWPSRVSEMKSGNSGRRFAPIHSVDVTEAQLSVSSAPFDIPNNGRFLCVSRRHELMAVKRGPHLIPD